MTFSTKIKYQFICIKNEENIGVILKKIILETIKLVLKAHKTCAKNFVYYQKHLNNLILALRKIRYNINKYYLMIMIPL